MSALRFRNFLLNALKPADLAALGPHLTEVQLGQGDVLFEPDSLVETICFPSSACVSLVTVLSDGDMVESATVGRESAVGLLDAITKQPSNVRGFVQIGGGALCLAAARFRSRLQESRDLQALTFNHVRAIGAQAEQGVACNAAHDVPHRLARWLLMTQDRTGAMTFTLTQEYMSVMVGVQRSTISVVAAEFKRAGLIAYSRGAVTVLDRDRLEHQACECYGVVERAFRSLGGETPSD